MKLITAITLACISIGAITQPVRANGEPSNQLTTGADWGDALITFTTSTGEIIEDRWERLTDTAGGVFVNDSLSLLAVQGGDTFSFPIELQNISNFEVAEFSIDLAFASNDVVFDTDPVTGKFFTVLDGGVSGNGLGPDTIFYSDEVALNKFTKVTFQWTQGEYLFGSVGILGDSDPVPVSTPEPGTEIALLTATGFGLLLRRKRR